MKLIVLAAAGVALASCGSITGAISGNTSDCAGAESQLSTARASLAIAQIALSSAEAFGSVPAITLAQTAVSTISADVNSIQALVTASCATPGVASPAVVSRFARAPTISLGDAKRIAASDKALAAALQARTKQ